MRAFEVVRSRPTARFRQCLRRWRRRLSRCRVEMEKEKDSEEEGGGGVSQRGAECGQARNILIGAVRVAPRPAAGIDGAGRGVSLSGEGAGRRKRSGGTRTRTRSDWVSIEWQRADNR
jgi:hypothetical protein